jgi:hypothetical protein
MTMLIGLSSLVLFGTWFAAFGAGQAVDQREAVNDAADSGAYAAAVAQARAMNLVALMNMVELSTVAVASAQQSISHGARETRLWIKASKRRRKMYGWTLPILAAIDARASATYGGNQSAYRAIYAAAKRIQTVLMLQNAQLVEQRVDELATAYAGVTAGVIAPWPRLPITPEPTASFCRRAFPFQDRQIQLAFQAVGAGEVRAHAEKRARGVAPARCAGQGVTSFRPAAVPAPGNPLYQVHAFSLANSLSRSADRLTRTLAAWGRETGSQETEQLTVALSEVGMAQGEFYYAGAEPPNEMLWHMRWQGKLAPVDATALAAFAEGCSRGGGKRCGESAAALGTLSSFVAR